MNAKLKNTLRRILFILCIVVIVLCVLKLGLDFYSGYKEKTESKKLATTVLTNSDNSTYTKINDVDVDFNKLSEINSDTVAWLRIPDTTVNYPIVHIPNDNYTYLYKNFDGEKSIYGTLFLDGENNSSFKDKVSFIFGHNVSTALTFGERTYFTCLIDFEDENFLKEHEKVFLYTKDGEKLEYKTLGIANVGEVTELYRTTFESDEDYASYLKKVEYALNLQPNTLNTGNKILVLSTCLVADEGTTQRRLLFTYR